MIVYSQEPTKERFFHLGSVSIVSPYDSSWRK